MDAFEFYSHMDSKGYDLTCVGKKTLGELMSLCEANDKCVAFNTLGYMKFNVSDVGHFIRLGEFREDDEGLYVHRKKAAEVKVSIDNRMFRNFDGYVFYPYKDSPDNDLRYAHGKTIVDLKKMCDADGRCAGFNTLGFLKSRIRPESEFINLSYNLVSEGLYVKKTRWRVKMLCNWCSSRDLCNDWNRMSQGNYRWNDIEITWEDRDVDLYVIVNKPLRDDFYKKNRTIVFHMEPWCGGKGQEWGVKTWGEWAEPDESKFLQIRSHKKYYNNGFWQLRATYNDLRTMEFRKTGVISSVCSSKYFDPGHLKRIDFLKFLEGKGDPLICVDIYNTDNEHGFRGYKGPHPVGYKDAGIAPYKYYFMPENNVEHNFMTEKIWEPLLVECLAFYWGCPNLSEYIDPRAYIVLDLDDFEGAFNVMRDAILNDEWGKRLEIIRMEKQKVLHYFGFFPTLERILHKDLKLPYGPSDDDIMYHKYFSHIIGGNKVKSVAFVDYQANIMCVDVCDFARNVLRGGVGMVYFLNYGIVDLDEGEFMSSEVRDRVRVINYSRDVEFFGVGTVNLLRVFADRNQDASVMYFNLCADRDVAGYLNYFLVGESRLCMDLLGANSVVGLGINSGVCGSGWWARGRYLATLGKLEVVNDLGNDLGSNLAGWIWKDDLDKKCFVCDIGINPAVKISSGLYDNQEVRRAVDSYYEFDSGMRIKCVNLERRKDRRGAVGKLLEGARLAEFCDFVAAVDGKELSANDELLDLFDGNDFGSKRGAIGCALSHYKLWQDLVADPVYTRYLVLEDDIEFADNIRFKLNQLDKITRENGYEYDVVYLGFHIRSGDREVYREKIRNINVLTIIPYDTDLTIGGTFGYIVTKTGAQKFLDFVGENGIKHGVDYMMFHYGDKMKVKLEQFESVPQLIFSEYAEPGRIVDSDIQYDNSSLF